MVFDVAQSYLHDLSDESYPYRIARGTYIANKYILATIFYEPSTRTRLSFESAMLRLGGHVVTSADPNTSSAAKGESLADAVRVISNYADIIVIRHPKDGAARLAAEYSAVPVINGGDGSHEHPTQTLCDLFTLKTKNKSLKHLNVTIAGDLKKSRTVHSFVYALARFGAHIAPMAAPGMELPAHVDRRLREEFNCTFDADGPIGAFYRTPEEPHQPALFSPPEFEIYRANEKPKQKVAAIYVTRFQKERTTEKEGATEKDQPYLKVDAEFLKEPKFSRASVLHPLPRVGELSASFDTDVRAMYFQQAAYGVPVRMALIASILGLKKGRALQRFEDGFDEHRIPAYNQPKSEGLQCINQKCIIHDDAESPYVRNKFHFVKTGAPARYLLRCAYCETDIDQFVIANKKNRWFTSDISIVFRHEDQNFRDLVAFSDEAEAQKQGYHSRRHANLSGANVAGVGTHDN